MTPEQRAIKQRLEDARWQAECTYNRALETYNDNLRDARKTFDAALAAADKQFRAELAALDARGSEVI